MSPDCVARPRARLTPTCCAVSLRQTYRGVLSNPTLTTFTSEVEGTAAPVEGDARAVAGAKRVADAVDQAPDAETAAASRADKKRKA